MRHPVWEIIIQPLFGANRKIVHRDSRGVTEDHVRGQILHYQTQFNPQGVPYAPLGQIISITPTDPSRRKPAKIAAEIEANAKAMSVENNFIPKKT